ncbi:serine hydrolase [Psychroserpens sp. SPM9]|uniref:serine hydrolase n=1 Tax=Psychroserpens sp. SPM9 TaxID=2975598 RepID=UPI0021A80606|nr:serine hydrolase [Psychroserpens sp. SPM9]MDG5492208.1 serine hydrolase [Psychroserpens sp. SPM9]
MKKLALLLCALLMTISIDAQDKRLKGVEKELNKILEATKAAGFAVAVVDGDKIVYAKGFGYSDYENKIPADANTLFAIGSSTKAFTSAILGLLRADDKLSFDDNPRKHIPELEFFDDNMNNNMIIKDLMRHSTGLPRHDGSWYYFPTHSKDSLMMRIKHHEPFTGIRQQWYYNNFGFLAQGVIAERITSKSWEDNLKEYFFTPLEMNRTNASIAEMKSSSNAALGYEVKDDQIKKMDYYDIAGMSPAGSINSSVNDMSKWLITWMNNGKYKDSEIIPENYINEAMSSQMVVGGNIPDEKFPDIHFANYGYGWFLQSYKGHYRVDHGGNIDGFSANVAFFPTDKIGIVVLANQNGSPVPSLVRNTIADRMIGEARTDWVGRYEDELEKGKKAQKDAEENSETSNVKNTKPSHISLDYTGTYAHEGYGKFEIVSENDSLFSTINSDKIYLHHYHYDVFEMIDVIEGKVDTASYGKSIKIAFATNDAGDISGAKLKIEPTLDALEFKRTPNTIDVDTKTLEQYTGEYDISGTGFKIFIKNEALYLFIKGQPEYELIPTAKHKFSFKTLEGFKIEFIESENGTITELKAIQPNGTFVAKRK